MAGSDKTGDLLKRVHEGETSAFEELFARHRTRLERMIRARMDSRLARRLDPADIVQETYLEAARRFDSYSRKPELSFYLWLCWIARDKIIQEYRRHVGADKRAIGREQPLVSGDASAEFVRELVATDPSPTQELASQELSELMQEALLQLDEDDRQIVIWRSFEQMSVDETAELLKIGRAAAGKRFLRALEKLRKALISRGIVPG